MTSAYIFFWPGDTAKPGAGSREDLRTLYHMLFSFVGHGFFSAHKYEIIKISKMAKFVAFLF